ncbi:hypothetical protein HAX54_026968, partial [Datura stramonium]|nr:hypothetical protein [Datura stramonium]
TGSHRSTRLGSSSTTTFTKIPSKKKEIGMEKMERITNVAFTSLSSRNTKRRKWWLIDHPQQKEKEFKVEEEHS